MVVCFHVGSSQVLNSAGTVVYRDCVFCANFPVGYRTADRSHFNAAGNGPVIGARIDRVEITGDGQKMAGALVTGLKELDA